MFVNSKTSINNDITNECLSDYDCDCEYNIDLKVDQVESHLTKFKELQTEINIEAFVIFHIVEVFWLISDLLKSLIITNQKSKLQLKLINAAKIWSRDQDGFSRAKDDESINSTNVYIGGNLGYNTGMLRNNSLDEFSANTIAYFAATEHQEYLGNVYTPLFTEIIRQFIRMLEDVKSEIVLFEHNKD